MKKRNIHQSTHPFDACPFEAFHNGSWKAVECLRIGVGAIVTLLLNDDGDVFEECFPISNLRLRSRKATFSDCSCFLRPGVDVCVLSTCQLTENASEEEDLEPVWLDAKIVSIERKPHETECACQFYVRFYVTKGPLGVTNGKLHKDTRVLKIDQISILQKLDHNPCEKEHYRWDFSEDCSSLQKYKLFPGKFSSDISWLLVASVQRQIEFDVRLIQKRIVYQILDSDCDEYLPNSEGNTNALNFKLENGFLVPIIIPLTLAKEIGCDTCEDKLLSAYDLMGLRRSKRRQVQPERLGCGDLLGLDIDEARIHKPYGRGNEEVKSVASDLEDHQPQRANQRKHQSQLSITPVCGETDQIVHEEDFLGFPGKMKSEEVKSVASNWKEHQLQLANQRKCQSQLSITPLHGFRGKINSRKVKSVASILKGHQSKHGNQRNHQSQPSITPVPDDIDQMVNEDDQMVNEKDSVDFTEANKGSRRKFQRKRGYSMCSEHASFCNTGTYRKRSFSARLSMEIRKCMENINSTVNKEQPPAIDQWNKIRAGNFSNGRNSSDVPLADEEENSEIEMLFQKMEFCMASACHIEDIEGSNVELPTEVAPDKSEHCGQVCQHEYKLNEEIGIICQLCGIVKTEIKDVSPTFYQCIPRKGSRNEENPEHKLDENAEFDFLCNLDTSNMPLSEGEENVWVLIPDLKRILCVHQKRAFEFLWRNIAGSLVPSLMEQTVKKRGGCVISHSPGAGKTLLIIAFLVSYLKLFPGSRPLVLAPKTTLCTWYKEITKWEMPVPIYQIHGQRTYRDEVLRQKLRKSPETSKSNQDFMHIIDGMEKIQKWLDHPSVLLMGYSSFLALTREDSKLAHRKYMGQVLRQCPGILVLDEGHNPRSTKSRLRRALMKVKTRLRILLSGTLFQNNFREYFNTLTLARPSFVNEVLRKLDPKFKKREKGATTLLSLENTARRFFIDKIAKKIDSREAEERMQGLNMLKNLTSGFIDVYEGGSSDKLPGLQCYTLMMKSTPLQLELLAKLNDRRPVRKLLEFEFLITLVSVHPCLITTTPSASQYFSKKELKGFEDYKNNLKLGSKVRFVMSLVPRCILRNEKVLIFCHNISPIHLFLDIFESFYGWKKGKEVLVLQGEMELFERGRVMDKFEEPGGDSKVMLASITACAEGISLTAASRVILLDSEWNPSKRKQAIARAFRPGQAKMVHVYQLLATGTLEEEKFNRTTWKEWVSGMIFSEELVEDPSHCQAEKIEDDVLREILEEERATLFHRIMKVENTSNWAVRGK
ncbi:SNF2 domain-containing protein CLASSY 1-like [Actinidia eriantha]|uniref:SNF2 domain-containing protein CLASSY 1-like n=1 Tax=Actinidia eriantha TaxID=165200 RepID=UPI0025832608|nr:SNF2 domain-containing protein CLASSY 1-like [Actinidia eriantha]